MNYRTFKRNILNLKIMINNVDIEEEGTAIFLGVQLDNNLNSKSY